jgi:hypothetical protein
MTENEARLFHAIRAHLAPDLLTAGFKDRPDNPFYGHCFHASIALYKLLGGKDCGYSVWKAIDATGVPHYWLVSPAGDIIDATAEQYTNFGSNPPYLQGKRTGFRVPKSAKSLIAAVQSGCGGGG